MNHWKPSLAIAGLALTPLLAIGGTFGAPALSQYINPVNTGAKGSEGARREAVLLKATAKFVAKGQAVTQGMRKGEELAPVAALNVELEAIGSKWRVSKTDGMAAETYGVS